MAQNDERRNEEFDSYFDTERRTRVIIRWILAVSLVVTAVAASAFMKIGSGSIVEAETERKVAVERTNELQVLNEAAQTQVLMLTKRVEELEEDPYRPVFEPDRSVEEMLLVQLEDSRQDVAAWTERYNSLQRSIDNSTVVDELRAQINALMRTLAQCEKDRDTALAKVRELNSQISRLRLLFESRDQNIRRLERDLAACKSERDTALAKVRELNSQISRLSSNLDGRDQNIRRLERELAACKSAHDSALTQEKALRSLIREVFNSFVEDFDRSEFIAEINSSLFRKLKDAAEGN